MISIRRQLTREILGAVLILLGGGLWALYFAARDAATDQFDRAMRAKAFAITTLTVPTSDGVRVEFTDHFMRGFDDHKPRDYFQVWNSDGDEIARSESLTKGKNLPRRTGKIERPAEWDIELPNGRPGRALGFAFKPKSAGSDGRASSRDVQLVVASDREELDETLWQLLGFASGFSVLLIGVTLWVIPRVLRRGLKPLAHLAEQANHIDADSLAIRFALVELPAELQPIAQRLNDLLGRLEQSFDRERRFSADLAHELRTPLAELRSMAECALKWPDTRDPELDQDTLAIAQQMERIVTHILALARREQGQLALKPERIPLVSLVESIWGTFAARASERELNVSVSLAASDGFADPALLRSVITNLCENAVEYTPTGGDICVTVRQEDIGRAVVSIANTTNDLGGDDLPKLFDRFWRKEASRSGGLHLGLGLSLARAFAKAMNWTLTAAFDGQGRLVFTLTGPAGSAVIQDPPAAAEPSTAA